MREKTFSSSVLLRIFFNPLIVLNEKGAVLKFLKFIRSQLFYSLAFLNSKVKLSLNAFYSLK